MKNFGRALLLLTLGLVLMSQAAMAQDALSAILPAPWTDTVGSQLMYYFEDGAPASRGVFKSYLTITNTNISTGVWLHFQFYKGDCTELFDFVDYMTPGQRHIFDPSSITGTFYQTGVVGWATDGKFLMTATPVLVPQPGSINVRPSSADLRAVPFNHMTGQIWVSDVTKSATYMTNAVPRMAVDAWGNPLIETLATSALVPDKGTYALNGETRFFQYFRPIILSVNSFFPTSGPGAVQAGVPFGNRMTFLTWVDDYSTSAPLMYRIQAGKVSLSSFVFDNAENAFSVPPQDAACGSEFTLAPDVAGAKGNHTDFLGAALGSAVKNTGGWLRMRVSGLGSHENVLGWFSQYLGTFGGGDYLIGQGRTSMKYNNGVDEDDVNMYITVSNSAGETSTVKTTTENGDGK